MENPLFYSDLSTEICITKLTLKIYNYENKSKSHSYGRVHGRQCFLHGPVTAGFCKKHARKNTYPGLRDEYVGIATGEFNQRASKN
ncbi:MAG: hypothetical protein Fur0023_11850 [Bacteroidia bacterium]